MHQTMAKEYIQPFSLIAARFLIAGVVMTPIAIVRAKQSKEKFNWKAALIGGAITGAFLASASVFQQFGITKTSTGKAGFLTAMYIIFVPLISIIAFRKKIKIFQWLGVAATVIGTGLLSLQADFSINLGDYIEINLNYLIIL